MSPDRGMSTACSFSLPICFQSHLSFESFCGISVPLFSEGLVPRSLQKFNKRKKEKLKKKQPTKLQAMWESTICTKYFQTVVANVGHVLNLSYPSKYLDYTSKTHAVPPLVTPCFLEMV
jgi:hypothetical protein